MADFRHPDCTLIRRGIAGNQLIFEVNFDHFAHQTIRRTTYGGDLLQNGQAWFAGFQRTLKRINLAAYATNAGEDALFICR